MHRARHALTDYHSLTVRSDGEEWTLDFASEIDGPTEAMELRGIDTSQGLPAPMRRGNDNDAFVAYYATLLGNRPPGTLAELDDCMVAYWDAKAPY